MSMSGLTVNMDTELKSSFEAIADELGLGVNAAVTAFAKAVVRRRGIPFELVLKTSDEIEEERFYSEPNVRFLLNSRDQIKRGETVSFDSVEEPDRAARNAAACS